MRQIKVLLIHGAWCTEKHLLVLAAVLRRAGFYVRLLTLRGHGPGEDPSGLSLEDYAEDVRKVLDEEGPMVLVGHSMGGFIAQMVAEQDSRVLAQALLAPAGIPHGGFLLGWQLLLRILHPHYWWGMMTGRAVRCATRDLKALLLNKVSVLRREREVLTFRPESGRALLEIALAQIRFWEKRPKARQRVLVLVGEADKTMPPSLERKIARAYGRRALVLRETGHMPFSEPCGTRVAGHVARWIKKAVPLPAQQQAAE